MNGLWRPQQQASCTRPPVRETRPTYIVNRSVRTLAAHSSTFTPKKPRGLGGMGKLPCLKGLAARLAVGLVRGSNVGGSGGDPARVHTTQELPSPSASTHAHPRSIRMGHGSLHVDFKVNTEA